MTDHKTYPVGITSELLMAYADNTLSAEETAQIDGLLTDHPDLLAEVEDYRLTAARLGGAFSDTEEEIPEAMRAHVMGRTAENENVVPLQKKQPRRAWHAQPWGQAMAASLLLAAGVVIGTTFTGNNADSDPFTQSLFLAGPLPTDHPVAMALENTPSARMVTLADNQFDSVATFRTEARGFCREFELSGDSRAVVGIACRPADRWQVEILLAAEPGASPQTGFQLASGFDTNALEQVLDQLGAGIGLSREAEACLLKAGWENTDQCE